ncbi:MAG: flagellar basal body rod protein FlgB [Selenomonadaceae bacterium]|nr:flagellar basal body rod protein FlgB [Selenomonadaceae bacterium]
MLDTIMNSSNFNYLSRAMVAANIRQEVIANNIANVNTPNFRKSDLVFEDLLAEELYGPTDDGRLKPAKTHAKHLPPPDLPFYAMPQIVEDRSTLMRVDDNNVDIDIEMANLAKNQIYYNALATQMTNYINKMKSVITSGQQ